VPRKRKGRAVNGILVLDKPSGISSNNALQKVKRLFQAHKAGHTGSLDPLATGVLPICLGEATKVSHFLLDADKTYLARCALGSMTTTGDAEGETLETRAVPSLTHKQLSKVLAAFIGPQSQTPPMYSALKHNGRPLYEYARQGIEIERKSRKITIFDIKLLDYQLSSNSENVSYLDIKVHCSKGTYIRSLCEDIGHQLGCGAHISSLRRIQSGPFVIEDAFTLDELNKPPMSSEASEQEPFQWLDSLLSETDNAVLSFPVIALDPGQYQAIQNGQKIRTRPEISSEYYRLYFNNTLIGLGILEEDNNLKPKRLLFL
jgi:tRNA pseudouridine55 synthase